ncbi:hypothetical protein BZG06_11510 [Salinivibrio kushneri]|uniref:N-acetyltransferase domain-containing protein n=1 Tax=Salinivibrio kushneri TaxID=1908198 RepID=A0AB36K2E2_9GAMM|nr:GNAT family N-acetyltransferase [Salinivibrio kushneri]OOE42248.1 hypothetical protein BZG09_14315 [Salinivibrio kushneri]OOE43249.1 hypothetical protein BZG06_11510 [Salinivibrio kushneri]
MFPATWRSKRLCFSAFEYSDAKRVKALFEQNQHLQYQDPTFKPWSLSTYQSLIADSAEKKAPDVEEAFYLRRIQTHDGKDIGYLQISLNAPDAQSVWLPMLTISPRYQKHGYGSEAVASVIDTVQAYGDYRRMGVNVYAENIHAFRFWYQQGFCRISHFEPEQDEGRDYHCLVLYRDLDVRASPR